MVNEVSFKRVMGHFSSAPSKLAPEDNCSDDDVEDDDVEDDGSHMPNPGVCGSLTSIPCEADGRPVVLVPFWQSLRPRIPALDVPAVQALLGSEQILKNFELYEELQTLMGMLQQVRRMRLERLKTHDSRKCDQIKRLLGLLSEFEISSSEISIQCNDSDFQEKGELSDGGSSQNYELNLREKVVIEYFVNRFNSEKKPSVRKAKIMKGYPNPMFSLLGPPTIRAAEVTAEGIKESVDRMKEYLEDEDCMYQCQIRCVQRLLSSESVMPPTSDEISSLLRKLEKKWKSVRATAV